MQSIVNGTTSAFTYGADGLRRSSTVTPSGGSPTTTRYAYDGQTMVRSLRQNGQGAWAAAATYLAGPRGMEYRRDDLAGTVRWYVYDGLGSVVGELDPSGNLTAGKKYDVYGAERTGGTGASTSRQGFCGSLGHIADSETGLVYMKVRYYDPNVGRFESEDPLGDGDNWFAYCDDNPVNCVDPTGTVRYYKPIPGTDWFYALEHDLKTGTDHIELVDKNKNPMGSYWKDPQTKLWKHGDGSNVTNKVRKGMAKVGHPIPAMDSISASLENDPLGTIAILLDVNGDHEDAAQLDRINDSL